jgi:hypothetical protein
MAKTILKFRAIEYRKKMSMNNKIIFSVLAPLVSFYFVARRFKASGGRLAINNRMSNAILLRLSQCSKVLRRNE